MRRSTFSIAEEQTDFEFCSIAKAYDQAKRKNKNCACTWRKDWFEKSFAGKIQKEKTNQICYGTNIPLKDVVLWLATLAK